MDIFAGNSPLLISAYLLGGIFMNNNSMPAWKEFYMIENAFYFNYQDFILLIDAYSIRDSEQSLSNSHGNVAIYEDIYGLV